MIALIVSIPSAALAVLDLADRIRKRNRAEDLLDHAHQLTAQNLSLVVTVDGRPVTLTSLSADHVLDIASADEQAN